MNGSTLLKELVHTAGSLCAAAYDWLVLRTPIAAVTRHDKTFAFLVHPRTDDFAGADVYGLNDVFRPFPALRYLSNVLPRATADRVIRWFASAIVPITLSRISVCVGDATFRGYLLTTVRTPSLLFGSSDTKRNLSDLFALASRKGVRRVGLGALLPSMTKYGERFTNGGNNRPAVSTGHAYTAYTIAEYLRFLTDHRNASAGNVRVAIVGAAGSTGKALVRVLKLSWRSRLNLDLQLVDLPKKTQALQALVQEAYASGRFASVKYATRLEALHEADYVVIVTNAKGSIIGPEHVNPGAVIIDDSQPRNTSTELVAHGCHVVDVLARVPGLDCHFDFGFRTEDKTVTFTCLAETILATIAGDRKDLAVGEVTDAIVERTFEIAQIGKRLGLVGDLPLFSFGEEMSPDEQAALLAPALVPVARAAE